MSLEDSLNKDVDGMMLSAINSRFERFIEAKSNPEKILVLFKEIMSDPGVLIAASKELIRQREE